MGMSTHVVGFAPPDARFMKMKAAWDACRDAGVDPPDEVGEFFQWDPAHANASGAEVGIKEAVTEWTDGDMREGYEIDLTALPKGVSIIRVYNSY